MMRILLYRCTNILSLALLLSLLSSTSFADLLISPTRVVLDERTRSATITLINSGHEQRTYRLSWKHLLALPQGGYRPLTEAEQKNIAMLDRIVRVSPKQVSLAPGERQSIKLLVRRQLSMGPGEYRSHLRLTALPATDQGVRQTSKGATFQLNMLVSYTLPIIYRLGDVKVNVTLSDIELVSAPNSDITYIQTQFSHINRYSTSGRLVALWKPKSGKERQVGLLNNYNIYPETRQTVVKFPWHNFELEPGTLTIRYEGQQEFQGQLLAEKTLAITPEITQSIR